MPRLNLCLNREEKEDLVNFLKTNGYPDGLTKDQKRSYRRKANNFVMLGDYLCFRGEESLVKVVFPFETEMVNHIIATEHNISHVGVNKLQDIIRQKYYGIPCSLIADYVRSCVACQRYNSMRTIQPIYVNDISRKYDRFLMDCVDLRRYADQNDGYGWMLNVIDTFTKYLWSFKLTNKTADSVKQSLDFIFCNFGVPVSIQSDNGKEFRNQVLHNFLSSLNITIIHGRPRNPKSQGQVERVNQTVKRRLSKKLHHTNSQRWIDVHRDVVYGYNTTIHRATNKSPFMLFFGHRGFNLPVNNGGNFIEDQENGLVPDQETVNNNVSEPIEYQEWDLTNPEPVDDDIQSQPISNNLVILDTSESDDKNDLRSGVLEHFQRYKQKMIENADSNFVSRTLNIGDQVLIKKDFDMNPGTKKQPFESFYEDSTYIVTSFHNNNMVELKDSNGNIKTVFRGVIKKI